MVAALVPRFKSACIIIQKVKQGLTCHTSAATSDTTYAIDSPTLATQAAPVNYCCKVV